MRLPTYLYLQACPKCLDEGADHRNRVYSEPPPPKWCEHHGDEQRVTTYLVARFFIARQTNA